MVEDGLASTSASVTFCLCRVIALVSRRVYMVVDRQGDQSLFVSLK